MDHQHVELYFIIVKYNYIYIYLKDETHQVIYTPIRRVVDQETHNVK